jgi:hypothetical protein
MSPASSHWRWKLAAWSIVIMCSIYGALPYAAQHWCAPGWFPPYGTGFATEHGTLGGEYFNIAMALVCGRGYSDPFFVESGPTAWMPPLLPTIDAVVFTFSSDNREGVVWFSLIAQILVLGWVTGDIIDRMGDTRSRIVTLLCIAVVLAGNFYHLFQITHDGWLLLLLAHGCVRMLLQPASLSTTTGVLRWGVWGGLCSLASPPLCLAWLVASWNVRHVLAVRGVAIALGIALAMQAPWLVRNAVVFHRFVPVKSNGWFELEQSLSDFDGVLDLTTFANHPIASEAAKQRYLEKGEMAFLDERKAAIWKREPGELTSRWLRHVWNRAVAAFLWKMPINERFSAPWFVTVSRALFAAPFLVGSIAFLLGWRPSPELRNVGWFALVYLTPYLAISFYDRYMIPILGVTILVSSEAAIYLVQSHWGRLFGFRGTTIAS